MMILVAVTRACYRNIERYALAEPDLEQTVETLTKPIVELVLEEQNSCDDSK